MQGNARIISIEHFLAHTSFRNLTIVKITTDEGLVGWGDATLVNREHAVAAHLEYLKSVLLGVDALATEYVWRRIAEEDFFMRADIVGRSAAAGVMMACADITARAYSTPAYRLFGGPIRSRIPVYANGWYRGERTPESYGALAREVVAKGYRALKLDPFGAAGARATHIDVEEGAQLVAGVREAVGPDVEIFIDAHGRFTPHMARRVAMSLDELRVGFLEEPIAPDDWDGMRALRNESPMPIAGGERSIGRPGYRLLIESECVDVVQPDITWCGGPFEVMTIARWAEVHQMLVSIHNANSPLATAIGCHLGAAIPNFIRQEMFEDYDEPWVRDAFPGFGAVKDGTLELPDGPGWGVVPNEDALREHPFEPVFLNLWAENWETFEATLSS
jgi:galactonate dehydratase